MSQQTEKPRGKIVDDLDLQAAQKILKILRGLQPEMVQPVLAIVNSKFPKDPK